MMKSILKIGQNVFFRQIFVFFRYIDLETDMLQQWQQICCNRTQAILSELLPHYHYVAMQARASQSYFIFLVHNQSTLSHY